MNKKLVLLVSILFLQPQALSHINLQDYVQDFIVRTKRIYIPEYPDAFNPSILKVQNKFLLAFRTRNNTTQSLYVGFVWLDDRFHPISKPSLLKTRNANVVLQDPRLIMLNNEIYLIYNDLVTFTRFQSRRMFVAKLEINNDQFVLKEPHFLKGPWDNIHSEQFDYGKSKVRQKNWVPFLYKNRLHFSYTLSPHKVIPYDESGEFDILYSTQTPAYWPLGQLRGGTPAIKMGDRYISFFHSCKIIATHNSDGEKMRHYFMGAYTFKAEPPFEITHISPEPIVGRGFYDGRMDYKTWTSLRVIFPMGCIVGKKFIWVSYGRQDFESWIVQINKKKLLRSLVPVKQNNHYTSNSFFKKLHRHLNSDFLDKTRQIDQEQSLDLDQRA